MAVPNNIVWRPGDDANDTALARFRVRAEAVCGRALPDYAALHAFSVNDRAAFWRLVWDFAGVRGEPGDLSSNAKLSSDGALSSNNVIADDALPGARWFPDGRLNFTENLLVRTDAAAALIWRDEAGNHAELSWHALHDAVTRTAAGLARRGVRHGDRVAAIVPNRIATVVLALATAQLGAIWSSCSPDFGASAIVDRFAQIEPKLLIGCAGYTFNGRAFDCLARLAEVRAALPSVQLTVLIDATDQDLDRAPDLADAVHAGELINSNEISPFVHFPFATPLYILFSSGTTGPPKCIVHSAGGTLLKHRSEQLLHCDFKGGERVLFFTTCGWMMWNWLVSALACGSTVCLYDGAPLHPDPGVLLRFADEARVQHLGISPGFLAQLAKLGYSPRAHHDLSSLRSVLSTGSPLASELYEWHYQHMAPFARLSSMTGGTDLIGCFALGNPLLPVHASEIQCAGLGMDIAFVDDDGQALGNGEQGELVCRASFPSVPLGFWHDTDGQRFRDAYFERYPGMWHHGDFGEFTLSGGVIIHGRSDATLNRAGVRIGTAEIYRQVEAFTEVVECLAVSQVRGDDLRVVLFVRMQPDVTLDDALQARIREALRTNASPRHVPDVIIAAPDLPRTRSGKLTEIAVRELIHGRPVKNLGALANPESLGFFKDLPALQ